MRATSNQRLALSCAGCLLLGAIAGWAVAQLGPRAPGATVLAAGPSSAPGEREPAPERELAAPGVVEVSAPRVEIEGEEPALFAPPAAGNVGDASAEVAPELRAELAAFLRSSRYEDLVLENNGDPSSFLIQHYLMANEPHKALALLERFPSEEGGVYGYVAQSLLEAGDRDAARAMFLAAIERDPFEGSWIEPLRELDPAGALAVLEAQVASEAMLDDQLISAQRASLLAALGRTDEARELLAAALAHGAADEWTIDALLEVDPEWAERELRQRLEGQGGSSYALRLAEHLIETERGQEGAELLERVLAQGENRTEAMQALLNLAPERALAALEAQGSADIDPWVLSQAGRELAERGRSAEAVDLWLHAAALDLSDETAVGGLAEHAPDRLWQHCRAITAETRDDELLGDVADIYWRHGRRDEAIELWKRARGIDPGDSEWREKLRQASRGLEPL